MPVMALFFMPKTGKKGRENKLPCCRPAIILSVKYFPRNRKIQTVLLKFILQAK